MPSTFPCPNCGETVRHRAKACPHCGSDADTGWSAEAETAGFGVDDFDENDYDDFIAREMGGGSQRRNDRRKTLLLILMLALLFPLLFGLLRLF